MLFFHTGTEFFLCGFCSLEKWPFSFSCDLPDSLGVPEFEISYPEGSGDSLPDGENSKKWASGVCSQKVMKFHRDEPV